MSKKPSSINAANDQKLLMQKKLYKVGRSCKHVAEIIGAFFIEEYIKALTPGVIDTLKKSERKIADFKKPCKADKFEELKELFKGMKVVQQVLEDGSRNQKICTIDFNVLLAVTSPQNSQHMGDFEAALQKTFNKLNDLKTPRKLREKQEDTNSKTDVKGLAKNNNKIKSLTGRYRGYLLLELQNTAYVTVCRSLKKKQQPIFTVTKT